jgi:hypothetical protein
MTKIVTHISTWPNENDRYTDFALGITFYIKKIEKKWLLPGHIHIVKTGKARNSPKMDGPQYTLEYFNQLINDSSIQEA